MESRYLTGIRKNILRNCGVQEIHCHPNNLKLLTEHFHDSSLLSGQCTIYGIPLRTNEYLPETEFRGNWKVLGDKIVSESQLPSAKADGLREKEATLEP